MFKKGDRVRRIQTSSIGTRAGLIVGNIYTVLKDNPDDENDLYLEEINAIHGPWCRSYFELVDSSKEALLSLIEKANTGFEAFHVLINYKSPNVFYTYPQWEGKTVPLNLAFSDSYQPAKVEYKQPNFVYEHLSLDKEKAKELKQKLEEYLGE